MPPSGKAGPSEAEQVIDVDPLLVYFTFSRIRPRFSCGRTIESTLQQFRDSELHPRDLPLLSVLTDGAHYYSQNNRRLYVYKQLRREGLLETLPVRLRPLPQTKRMHSKYSPNTCTLNATLMRETGNRGTVGDASATAADNSNALNIEDSHKSHEAGTSWIAIGKPGVGDNEPRSVKHPAPSSSSQPPPASCATAPGLEEDMVEGGDRRKTSIRKSQKKQQCREVAPSQQSSTTHHSQNASRRPGKRKGAATARSPSTSGSECNGSGCASALEAELRQLRLYT